MRHDAFDKALTLMLAHEGGVSLDPDDPGGYTVLGIARDKHPKLELWTWIDAMMLGGQHHILQQQVDEILHYVTRGYTISPHNGLWPLVYEFYRAEFWNWLSGDEVGATNSDVAAELFDTAVNCGKDKGARILQEALNLLNRNEKDWPDIVVDGHIGAKTIAALTRCLMITGADMLLEMMNDLQSEHYIKLMRSDPTREKYRGWLLRAVARRSAS